MSSDAHSSTQTAEHNHDTDVTHTLPSPSPAQPDTQQQHSINDTFTAESEEKHSTTIDADIAVDEDDEYQTYILSNFSTLRTNLQWNDATLTSIIRKMAGIKLAPPDLASKLEHTVVKRLFNTLELDRRKLNDTSDDTVRASCLAINDFVHRQHALGEPFLSQHNNPFIRESGIIEETDDDDLEEKTSPQSPSPVYDRLHNVFMQSGFGVISDEVLNDACYKMWTEELRAAHQLHTIDTKPSSSSNRARTACCDCRQIVDSLRYTIVIAFRMFGLVDLTTDALLLANTTRDPSLWYMTVALTLSMVAPYIISYSSGIQLYLFQQTFDNATGFKRLLLLLFLLPTGIVYFVLLDIMDLLFISLTRWTYFVCCRRSAQEIGQYEQHVAEQFGMDRMNWEGFKRQRSIGQYMFESLPQFVIQLAFFVFCHPGRDDSGAITVMQLSLSLVSALANIIFTTLTLYIEAKCCRTSFISYSLNCIKARVGWVPQREHILDAATTQKRRRKRKRKRSHKTSDQQVNTRVASNSNEAAEFEYDVAPPIIIDYEMSYRRFCYAHFVDYDFSVTTVRYLMSALQMLNTNNKNTAPLLWINFRNTLRLLPLQDIIDLYDLCQKKNIKLVDMEGGADSRARVSPYDWSSAIQISKNYGKDVRLLEFARDDQGMPYIMKLMNLVSYRERRTIFRQLIQHDFDLNIHDLTTNESVVFTLLRSYDYSTLKYIFAAYGREKGVLIRLNYHNKDGVSALCLALQLFAHEQLVRCAPPPAVITVKKVEFLWQILVANGADLAFPCKKSAAESTAQDMSPLLFALKELKNRILARHLMRAKAHLYSYEIVELNALFVAYELADEEHWQPPSQVVPVHADDGDDADDDEEEEKMQPIVADEVDESWIGLLRDTALHCGRPITFITDAHGNNPLHHFILTFLDANRYLKSKMDALRLRRLAHLMFISGGSWTQQRNLDELYPMQLVFKHESCELLFAFADKLVDADFRTRIFASREFVQDIIDWILSMVSRVTKKYGNGTTGLLKGQSIHAHNIADQDVQNLGRMFDANILGPNIKWPNKYCSQSNLEKSAAVIDLQSTAVERGLFDAALLLKSFFRIALKPELRKSIQAAQAQQQQEGRKTAENDSLTLMHLMSRTKSKRANNKNVTPKLMMADRSNIYSSVMSDRQKRPSILRHKTSTQEVLATAPPPVLRQNTLQLDGGNSSPRSMSDASAHGNGTDAAGAALELYVARVNSVDSSDGGGGGNGGDMDLARDDHGENVQMASGRSTIESTYAFIVESLSLADVVTDVYVLYELVVDDLDEIGGRKTWFVTSMVLFMICPYLVSHSIMCSIVDTQRNSLAFNSSKSNKCQRDLITALACLLMTPLSIIWFIVVDTTFMLYLLFSHLILFLSCHTIDISDTIDDLLFQRFLGMSRMEIVGYRRLRTLSQFLFETIPQIILQACYLAFVDQSDTYGIWISIGVALAHCLLEVTIIRLDASASKMPWSHYAVVCLGARLNWVPFEHSIRAHKTAERTQQRGPVFNFECIETELWSSCGRRNTYRIEYEFSASSIKKLGEYFIHLPVLSSTSAPSNPYLAQVWLYHYKHSQLPVICLGATSCRSLDVFAFAEFFRAADKKVNLRSKYVDWARIIRKNTPNISADNVYLRRLCEEFINYGEVKLITRLAPLVRLETRSVFGYITSTASINVLLILKKYYNQSIHFGLDAETVRQIYALMMKNQWFTLYEVDASYAKVICLMLWYTRRTIFRHQDPTGSVRWNDHPERRTFLEQLIRTVLPTHFLVVYDSDAKDIDTARYRDDFDDGDDGVAGAKVATRQNVLQKKKSTRSRDFLRRDRDVLLATDFSEDDELNIGTNQDLKNAVAVTVFASSAVAGAVDAEEEEEDDEDEDGGTLVYLSEPDGDHVYDVYDVHDVALQVSFEILECFTYFQPQIEKFLLDFDLRTQQQNEAHGLRVGEKSLFGLLKRALKPQSVDLLTLVINAPWNVLQQFPMHVRFAELFQRLDPVVRRLEMVHGFGKYLLASSKYRQSNALKPFTCTVAVNYDSMQDTRQKHAGERDGSYFLRDDADDAKRKNVTDQEVLVIATDPVASAALYASQSPSNTAATVTVATAASSSSTVLLKDRIQTSMQLGRTSSSAIHGASKNEFCRHDVMGISHIEIAFSEFEVTELESVVPFDDEDEDDDEDEGSQHVYPHTQKLPPEENDEEHKHASSSSSSMGSIELFTVIPQKSTLADDCLVLNKVVLKEITFEQLLQSSRRRPVDAGDDDVKQQQQPQQQRFIVDLYDNEVLGTFRPIYMGRDQVELMPLRLQIKPNRSSIKVTCKQIEARITYLLRGFIDATAMKLESVLHTACSLQNLEFVQFIEKYQDVFDCTMVDDDFQNALHILCRMQDPDFEIFSLVLELHDLDINQIRYDGKTPFDVLHANPSIDKEKKLEMEKLLASMPEYRPSVVDANKDAHHVYVPKKLKNVLLIGCEQSGKHSLLKQIDINYQKRSYTLWEKCVQRSRIVKFMIESMKKLIKNCGDPRIASKKDADARHLYVVNTNDLQTIARLPPKTFTALNRLWKNKAIKRVFYEKSGELNLSDAVRYFFYRIDEIKRGNWMPTELDMLRAPYQYDRTVLTSKSYRVDGDISFGDHQIRWIVPKSEKILRQSDIFAFHEPKTSYVETVIFMVSLTGFMEMNWYKNENNYFLNSLKLFKRYCHDPRFYHSKFVLLLNKMDVLQKKIADKHEYLQEVMAINAELDEHQTPIDFEDHWDWIDLVQAMFRLQHRNRMVFSYSFSATDPSKVRSILREIEDITLQKNVPTIFNLEPFKKKALLSVKWIAVLSATVNEDNHLPQYALDLTKVTAEGMQSIASDADINIDYNSMLYKTAHSQNTPGKTGKTFHYLITMDVDPKLQGFIWAVWEKAGKKNKRKKTAFNHLARWYWQILGDQDHENGTYDFEVLYGILAALNHKVLRTQFDGYTLNRNPLKFRFVHNGAATTHYVSWWNMARMSKCNAIIVDGKHFLHLLSPLKHSAVEWMWYNNDTSQDIKYDRSCYEQLECSYQSNMETNFPLQVLINTEMGLRQTRQKRKKRKNIPATVLESPAEDEEEKNDASITTHSRSSSVIGALNNQANHDQSAQQNAVAIDENSAADAVQLSDTHRTFAHCLLTDLNEYMRALKKHADRDPKDLCYALSFGFSDDSKTPLSNMQQNRSSRTSKGGGFTRDVYRTYNGRYCTLLGLQRHQGDSV